MSHPVADDRDDPRKGASRLNGATLLVLLYFGMGLAAIAVAVSRGAGAGTVIFLLFLCAFVGPLGWIIGFMYESPDRERARDRARRMEETLVLHARRAEEEKKAAARRTKAAEQAIWDEAWQRTGSVEVADAAVTQNREAVAEAERKAAEAARERAREAKKLLEARAQSQVLGERRDSGG
jgi:hypothetical protein